MSGGNAIAISFRPGWRLCLVVRAWPFLLRTVPWHPKWLVPAIARDVNVALRNCRWRAGDGPWRRLGRDAPTVTVEYLST